MRKTILIAIIVYLSSCVNEHTENTTEEPKKPQQEAQDKGLLVVMRDKETCQLIYNHKTSYQASFKGIWSEGLTWVRNNRDTCWYGVENIERNTTIKFHSFNKYERVEIYKDSSLNKIENGEFYVRDINDTITIAFAAFTDGLTEFQDGDIMNATVSTISWKNDSTILVFPNRKGWHENDYIGYEVIELIRNRGIE
jgi:hypothetical protein